jgi:hypothetical protein
VLSVLKWPRGVHIHVCRVQPNVCQAETAGVTTFIHLWSDTAVLTPALYRTP